MLFVRLAVYPPSLITLQPRYSTQMQVRQRIYLVGASNQSTAPHIGHLYSLVTADILARFNRLSNPERPVNFVTGTDEHGMKIQRAAKAAGLEPRPFCDQLSQEFRVSNQTFTTPPVLMKHRN